MEGIAGIWRVSHQPKILAAWLVGHFAEKMETLSDEEVKRGIMYVFETFLKGHIDYREPDRLITSKWFTNKYSRGSYSSRSPETDRMRASAKILSVPLKNSKGIPTVLFAGEATHQNHYSVVHGAVATGYREAERLMRLRV